VTESEFEALRSIYALINQPISDFIDHILTIGEWEARNYHIQLAIGNDGLFETEKAWLLLGPRTIRIPHIPFLDRNTIKRWDLGNKFKRSDLFLE